MAAEDAALYESLIAAAERAGALSPAIDWVSEEEANAYFDELARREAQAPRRILKKRAARN